ncbi:T9SS type A sorting domain-containing protein [candidate division KSB1 bacterium]|nr:T9SS type A sorting domain-containing protein [candidate division KSB1 bacterium]
MTKPIVKYASFLQISIISVFVLVSLPSKKIFAYPHLKETVKKSDSREKLYEALVAERILFLEDQDPEEETDQSASFLSSVYPVRYANERYTIRNSSRSDTLSSSIPKSKYTVADNELQSTVGRDSSLLIQVFPGDSLILSVGFQTDVSRRTKLAWYFNDSLIQVSGANSSLLYRAGDFGLLNLDTIRVVVSTNPILKTSHTRYWIIESNTIGFTVSNMISPDRQWISTDVGDTIDFAIDRTQFDEPDSLMFRWYVNSEHQVDQIADTFSFLARRFTAENDTISVKVTDVRNDSLLFGFNWYADYGQKPVSETQYRSEPLDRDLFLFRGDSIEFRVHTQTDSLRISWFHNDHKLENFSGTHFVYHTLEYIEPSDTIRVRLSNTHNEILYESAWFIQIIRDDIVQKAQHPEIEFIVYPTQDTLHYQPGDTLSLTIDSIRPGFTCSWTKGDSTLVTDSNEFLYYLSEGSSAGSKDSVSVSVLDAKSDTVLHHIWYIEIQPTIDELVTAVRFTFLPDNDSLLSVQDSMRFQIDMTDTLSSVFYVWSVNDDELNNPRSQLWIHSSEIDSIDTVKVLLLMSDSSIVDSVRWIVEAGAENEITSEILFYPEADTLTMGNDSLKFMVEGLNSDSELSWLLNNEAIDTRSHIFIPDSMIWILDTTIVTVKVTTNRVDTLMRRWIVVKRAEPLVLADFYFHPRNDTTISVGDTLYLRVNSQVDSLLYTWRINRAMIQRDSLPEFRHTVSAFEQDTIYVEIFAADSMLLMEHRWIIEAIAGDSAFSYSEVRTEVDTLFFTGDSLLLSIVNDSTMSSHVWYLNDDIIAADSTTNYAYYPLDFLRSCDTVRVDSKNFDDEVVRNHIWYIDLAPPIYDDGFQISYFPATDTTFYYGDTILCRIVGGTLLTRYQWFVNSDLITDHDLAMYSHYATPMDNPVLSISVRWEAMGQSFTNQWKYTLQYHDTLESLPDVKLLYPQHDDLMTEDDEFIWAFDSAGYEIDDDQLFYIQLSTDSLFSEIICADTCRRDTVMQIVEFNGRDRLKYKQTYYWRILIADTTNKISNNRNVHSSFRFSSLYVELVQYYAEYTNDGNISINWTVEHDENLDGFNLYRSETNNSNYTRLNDDLIAGYGSFQYLDIQFEPGKTYFYRLEEICRNGESKYHPEISIESPKPQNFALYSNYPNPFNMRTVFKFQIPTPSHVTINIYNVLGRKIKTIVDEKKEAGLYSAVWDGFDDEGAPVVSGLYFYQMVASNFRQTRKLTVVR